jgi:hypothetical protein
LIDLRVVTDHAVNSYRPLYYIALGQRHRSGARHNRIVCQAYRGICAIACAVGNSNLVSRTLKRDHANTVATRARK